MTSCSSFAKSSRCEFVSKALRLFNNQRSGRFVVAHRCVPGNHRHFALESGTVKMLDVAELVAERLK
jgi:hypothetical protein